MSSEPLVDEVTICNQALSWLGQEQISSLDDTSDEAQWCKANYASLRDAVIEARMWTFATVKATSTSSTKDAWDRWFVHDVPADWLSVFRVYRSVTSRSVRDVEWNMEGGKIVSREEVLFLWGVQRVTDVKQFSPLFIQALAARLAADAAIPFTENRPLQADMWGLYNDKLSEASVRDGQQGSNETIRSDSLIDARLGGSSGGRGDFLSG